MVRRYFPEAGKESQFSKIETELSQFLIKGGEELGIRLVPSQVEKFLLYLRELQEWGKNINLTGIRDEREIIIKHFLDSLTCLRLLKELGGKVVDLGTGAGFPSLPIKIIRPQIELTLLEAREKRTLFLEHIVKILGLKEVKVLWKRVEDFGHTEERESFDYALCRAVAPLNVILEYGLPLVKVGGFFIAQKGPHLSREIRAAQRALEYLGGRIKAVIDLELPILKQKRCLISVKKIKTTPRRYSRRPGVPRKRPL